ncbi:MAG: hypothetical protein WCC48_14330 [Anaeromyxobacteraceae bacterium]
MNEGTEAAAQREVRLNGDKEANGRGRPAVGKWKRVALTERDMELLACANEQKFLTFDQVARWFPEGEPNPHCRPKSAPTAGTLRRRSRPGSWYVRERLRKLVAFDVLRRVPIFVEASAALLPGRTGFELLEGAGLDRGLPQLDAIDWKNFGHDRALTDLRWLFEKQFGARWQAERVLRRELGLRNPPDAIATMGGRTIAIELELTRKNLERYLAIIQRYLAWGDPRLDQILYVLPNKADLEHMFLKVLPAAVARTDLWQVRAPDLSRFRFTTLAAIPDRRTWWTTSTPSCPQTGTL